VGVTAEVVGVLDVEGETVVGGFVVGGFVV